jgi:phospholipase C
MAKTTGRREWLSTVARGAAAATVGAVLGQPHAARSDENGAHPHIKHIVVLMLENRSFDHMFGLMMDEIPACAAFTSANGPTSMTKASCIG